MPISAFTDIAGCLVASIVENANVTLDANGRVSQLDDLSGNGRHWTQSTTSKAPDILDDKYAGRVISFSAADAMEMAGASGLTIGTVVMLIRYDSPAFTDYDGLLYSGSSFFFVGNGGGGSTAIYTTGSSITTNYINNTATGTFGTLNQWNTWLGTATPASYAGALGLGRDRAFAGRNWNGRVKAIAIYDTSLGSTDRTDLYNYMQTLVGSASTNDPASIGGCTLWLKADAGVYSDAGVTAAVNNGTVYQWNDQSGDSNHYIQATSGNRPTYKTSQVNGLPALYFDATDDRMGGITVGSPYSIFVVYVRRNGITGARRALSGSNNWLVGPYSGNNSAYGGNWIDSQTKSCLVQDQVRVACVTNNGSTSRFYVNGQDKTDSPSNTITGTPGTLYVGSTSEPADSDLCEVVVYDSVLGSTDRDSVTDALLAKWSGASKATPVVGLQPKCWLKADAGLYTDAGYTAVASDGDAVYMWRDHAGYLNDFTQITSGSRPLYKTNIIGSLPAVRFDNTDDVLNAMNVEMPYTVFIVYAQHGANAVHRVMSGGTTGQPDWLIGPVSGFHSHYANGWVDAQNAVAVVADTFVAACATSTGSASSFHVNTTDITVTSGNVAAARKLILGHPSNPLDGDIAEVIIFDSALGSTDRDSVFSYLNGRYSLYAGGGGGGSGPTFRVMGFIG